MGSENSVYKIVVIGMRGAGKSAWCELLEPVSKRFNVEAFEYLEFEYTKRSVLQVWDLNGKHPHLWSHYTSNANGFVFVID